VAEECVCVLVTVAYCLLYLLMLLFEVPVRAELVMVWLNHFLGLLKIGLNWVEFSGIVVGLVELGQAVLMSNFSAGNY